MQANNPYIAGTPLRDSYGFFGRRDILDWVSVELQNIYTNALVLYGQRRVGKTTLLLQLQNYLPSDKFFPIYFDLQDQSKKQLGKVLADLADVVGDRANLISHKPDSFDDEGKYFRSVFLPALYKSLDEGCRPVFLLDEFDVLDREDEELLENTVASRALFPFLRQVMSDDIRPAFVFVVGRRTEDLRVDFNQMFKTSLTKELWVLDRMSAETLIRQAETNGTLRFTEQAVDRILQLTNKHPYLTQLICQRLWQRAYLIKPATIPVISVDEVTSSIPETLEVGEQTLIWLWNGFGPAEKIYAAALAEISDEGVPIPETKVITILTEYAARLGRGEVELAPQDLVTRHVLDSTGNREYLFAVELFRRWIKQERSLRDVVDEIDRVTPLAEQDSKAEWQSRLALYEEEEKLENLFTLGLGALASRDWDQAKKAFSEVVYIRPDYAKDGKSAVRLLDQAVTRRKLITLEAVFQSNYFRVSGSISLLIVIGYLVFIALQGLGIWEDQAPAQVALALTETSVSSNLAAANAPQPINTSIPTKTPSLTPSPIPQSSILLQEDFEDGKADGWGTTEGKDVIGDWVIKQGSNGSHYLSGTGPSNYPQIWYGDASLDWSDYAFESRIQFVKGNQLFICIRSDSGSAFYTVFLDNGNSVINYSQYNPAKGVGREMFLSPAAHIAFAYNKWYTIRVEIQGSSLRTYVDNKLIVSGTLPNPLVNVQGGIGYYMEGGDEFYIDDIKVWSLNETPTPAPAATVLPTEIIDSKGAQMVLVPAGEFTMGSNADDGLAECQKHRSNCKRDWFLNEEPVHQVYLDTFYIDKYEVTNAHYTICVTAGICQPPIHSSSNTHSIYYGNSKFDRYPVINVNWSMAKTYCEWRGAQLPTEAQWEKGARGTDGRMYPWGETIDCTRANYLGCGVGDAKQVGSYAGGVSTYGAYDLGGNVWEWVQDWYAPGYYARPPLGNPNGPSEGTSRILRGGSWSAPEDDLRPAGRYFEGVDPSYFSLDIGFRCANNASDQLPISTSQSPKQTEITIVVPSTVEWQNTTIQLRVGDKVSISASGEWSHGYQADIASTPLYGADGYAKYDGSVYLPSSKVGALIGKIGNGSLFLVGSELEFVSTENGVLYLGINDTPGAHPHENNTGQLMVTITIIESQ